MCLAPVVIAHGQGFFKKHNLDVELVNFGNSTEVLLEAIATGKADAGVGMALRWLKALEQGFDVKLTAGTHGGCLRLLSAVNGDVHKLEDLKGKTIGVTDMASPDRNFFSILLKKHGIDPVRDVDWRLFPADLLGTALERGEVQAISGSDPFMYRLINVRQGPGTVHQPGRGVRQPQLLRGRRDRQTGARRKTRGGGPDPGDSRGPRLLGEKSPRRWPRGSRPMR